MDERLPEELETVPDRFEDLPPEKQERLKSIIELRRRGLSNERMAKLLGVGVATIYRDNKTLRQLAVSRATNLDIKEEIGEALNFFDELADKAMEGYRSAIEDNEQDVYETSESGEKTIVRKAVPDHSQAIRYMATAATAKKQKVETILQVSTTHALNKVLLTKANESKAIDVASLRTEEDFAKAANEFKAKMYETERKMHIYRGPSLMDYSGNRVQYDIDMATHMKKFDEFIKAKEEFEKPWPHRKNRKNIDQKR